MKFGYIFLLPILFLFTCGNPSNKSSGGNEIAFSSQSRDFTPLNEFTAGIEGPAADRNGNIYAVNFAEQGTIGKVTPEGKSSLFVKLPEGSIGNGIRVGSRGELFIADYTNHNVLKIDVFLKEITVHAHSSEMNQPNDLAIRRDDTLFASDPNWKESSGKLWRIDPDGAVTLLESGMGTTNGLDLSPDEKTLYVNESVQRNVWAYDLSPQGEISNKRLLIQFPDFGMDGMRCDLKGNLYITRYDKGTVAMVSPKGKLIREIRLIGKKPSNIAFGGKDGRTCYVTLHDRGCFETFEAEYPGRAWQMLR